MKTSIATVCLSGTLSEKLHAAAAAGFDGVEIFEPDLVGSPESPEEIRALAARLGLRLDLYQPMRDVEGVDEDAFLDVLRRAEAKFALMRRLGIDVVLCCSNVATATIDDDDVSASQLRRLGELAQDHGIRIAFEALAWGRYIDDYRRAWRIAELADHPAVGVCLDSFHILSRGHDPSAIEAIPAEKIFFLQLADAPALSMDVLSWSRHHRLFPGEGSFDLARFLTHVVRAGYTGPVSLEVFNDTFRQTDVRQTAVHARRSLRWLEDAVARGLADDRPQDYEPLPAFGGPRGFDFVEIKAEDTSGIEALLEIVGFTPRGKHRTKPVTLWTAGEARVVLNEQHARGLDPHIAALGFAVPDADALTRRAAELGTPFAYRRTYEGELALEGAVAPDGTEIFWSSSADGATADGAALRDEPLWAAEFEHGAAVQESPVSGIDHVSLSQPWQAIDEATLFFASVLELPTTSSTEVASPRGLVQSRVIQSRDGSIRIPLNVAPPILSGGRAALPQHVAFACDDIVALARTARSRGMAALPIPQNYYDDLAARFDLDDGFLATLRELDLVYDRESEGEYLHFYTATVGDLFCEFVERRGRYDGYGAGNAPVRLSAQRAGEGGAGRADIVRA
ncbi:TIM barrel protein [Microbacterium sp. NPDC019599]|uniref:bifunctional sugar phosphate isomerase/epimerase/4-hydroxyphenylpyruvate dioxygenase family protein n=1 Tax=Microbacterium sp. NPDC019599 TaxID=3154690 RepID=UPI0033DEEBC6